MVKIAVEKYQAGMFLSGNTDTNLQWPFELLSILGLKATNNKAESEKERVVLDVSNYKYEVENDGTGNKKGSGARKRPLFSKKGKKGEKKLVRSMEKTFVVSGNENIGSRSRNDQFL